LGFLITQINSAKRFHPWDALSDKNSPSIPFSDYNQTMNISIILPLVFGWLSGWVVNYLSDDLPLLRKLYRPVCQVCQTKYNWLDYLFFRNCSSCGRKRSPRTLVVQAVMVVASLLIWLYPNQTLPYPIALILVLFLAVVFVIDIEHRVILHEVSLVGAIIGLGVGIFLHRNNSATYGLLPTIIGGAVGFGVMFLFYLFGVLFVKFMAKRRNMQSDEVALGFGDVNLAGILGLILGLQHILYSLFFAVVAGGLISLIIILTMLVLKKYKAFTAIPYAPFLILSAIYFIFFYPK
jgi:leader peptidase (prepilin peptidase)/N-methyltransferase